MNPEIFLAEAGSVPATWMIWFACVVAAIAVVVLMLWLKVGKLEDVTSAIRSEMQQQTKDLTISADRRSSILHNRINPLIETMSGLKGSQEVFVQTFETWGESNRELIATLGKLIPKEGESREQRTERMRQEGKL